METENINQPNEPAENNQVPGLDNTSPRKKLWTILGVVLIVAIGVAGFFGFKYYKKKNVNLPASTAKTTTDSNQNSPAPGSPEEYSNSVITDGSLPPELPKDLPLEKGVKFELSMSYVNNYVIKGGTVQYISAKTVEENYRIFKTYFQERKWKIVSEFGSVENKRVQLNAELERQKGTVFIFESKVPKPQIKVSASFEIIP